jgi:hypothetical protein
MSEEFEQAFFITAHIFDFYKTAMSLYGKKFREKTSGCRAAIKMFMDNGSANAVDAGLKLITEFKEKDLLTPMMIILISATIWDIEQSSCEEGLPAPKEPPENREL